MRPRQQTTRYYMRIGFVMPGSYCLRLPEDKEAAAKIEELLDEEQSAEEPGWEEKILCRACQQLITSPSERIEIAGSHEHTFANPAGIMYQIGCFKRAVGCGFVGPATPEWSWFKGFSWQVVVCSTCLTHLGWYYTSAGQQDFYGLILSRLVQAGSA